MKRQIEIIVSPTGEIRIEAVGFQGADCEQATRFLEEALGSIAQRQKKPEFYRNRRAANPQRIGS